MKMMEQKKKSPILERFNQWDWEKYFFYGLLAIMGIAFIGQIFRIEKILLFREILIRKIEFGEKPGWFFLVFLLPFGYLWWKGTPPFTWRKLSYYEKGAFFFFAYLLLAFFWVKYPKYHRRGVMVYIYCLCAYFTVRYFARDPQKLHKILLAFGGYSLILSLVNLWKYHIRHIPICWNWPSKIYVANILVFTVSLSFFFLLSPHRNSRKEKYFWAFTGVLSLLTIVASETRSAILGLPLALFASTIWFNRRNALLALLLGIISIGLSFTVYKRSGERMRFIGEIPKVMENAPSSKKTLDIRQSIWKKLESDESLRGRFHAIWPVAWEIIKSHPFGIGCKGYRLESKYYQKKYHFSGLLPDAHNTWLQIWVSIGIPGVIFYFAFVICLLFTLFSAAAKVFKGVKDSKYAPLLLASLTYFLTHFMSESLLHFYNVYRFCSIFAILVGLSIQISHNALEEIEEKSSLEKKKGDA